MNNLIQTIKNHRESIIIGEIGALLHDIGKLSPQFIEKQSLEGSKNFDHSDIDSFYPNLAKQIKDNKFNLNAFKIQTNVYSIIKEHHNKNVKDDLVKLFQSCDNLDSAADKGVVRKKQSKNKTFINSPFGFPKEKLDLQALQNVFDDLSNKLTILFDKYIKDSIELTKFRKSLIDELKITYTHALGETRVPSNDISLWDHACSTAALFKSILVGMILGNQLDPQKLKWRILSICWQGSNFINRGKKIADVLKRYEIIEDIKKHLIKKFEDEIPIGNRIYEDINGIYFTFPDLDINESAQLAEECSILGLDIIRKESDNEIWPFFMLSEPSRTLTIITSELESANHKRKIPRFNPTLFIEHNPKIIAQNPDLVIPKKDEDICPICQIRSKLSNEERCNICKKRMNGRIANWLSSSQSTIWIDELADKNNRTALLTLNFNLDNWLNGTMIRTILSQTFENWNNSKDAQKLFSDSQKLQKLRNRNVNIDSPFIEKSRALLKIIANEPISQDSGFKSELINTFFEDISSSQNKNDENYVEKFVENLKLQIGSTQFNEYTLQQFLFTQHPSPARLYRIWIETEEFFNYIIQEIKDNIYKENWKRLKFSINIKNLGITLETNEIYIIKIRGLQPEELLVFYSSKDEFWTIESLEKFTLTDKKDIRGKDAIETSLHENGLYYLVRDEAPQENLYKSEKPLKIERYEFKTENYYPLLEITKSPIFLRLILPANDLIKILYLITKRYNERFKKVLGKLPLNVGLFIANKKFPLYILLEASERLLTDEEVKKSEYINCWWNFDDSELDEYYNLYPIKNNKNYTLEDLSNLVKGKPYFLYPGYFDFEHLLSTTDRYKINYKNKKRNIESLRLTSGRPYYFYQIPQMIELYEILSCNLSHSQITFIEKMLISKILKWRDVIDSYKNVIFEEFALATLKKAFAEKWINLREETRNYLKNAACNKLLLDTILFFKHILKIEIER